MATRRRRRRKPPNARHRDGRTDARYSSAMAGAGEVFWVFLRLGLTSFGGPIAHLAYFRDAFVVQRQWLKDEAYADLVALCQFLPGPTSSQVGFAIGLQRAGALGALAAWLGFTAPSAVLMLAAGLGVLGAPDANLIHGLKLVALAIVAHAVVGMARSLLNTSFRWGLALVVLLVLVVWPMAIIAPALILVAGALSSLRWRRRIDETRPPDAVRLEGQLASGAILFLAVLLVPFIAIEWTNDLRSPLMQQLAIMARSGALVFGGGHAVLPLLEADVVGKGWLSEDAFLAGYGFAQAAPGPLFSFAAYVGAASGHGVLGGLAAMAALFLPGLTLTAVALPFWRRLKRSPRMVGFVAGASAAVVGVLAAALYDPIFISSVRGPLDLALAALGFAALQWLRAPSWTVVLGLGAAGAVLPLLGGIG